MDSGDRVVLDPWLRRSCPIRSHYPSISREGALTARNRTGNNSATPTQASTARESTIPRCVGSRCSAYRGIFRLANDRRHESDSPKRLGPTEQPRPFESWIPRARWFGLGFNCEVLTLSARNPALTSRRGRKLYLPPRDRLANYSTILMDSPTPASANRTRESPANRRFADAGAQSHQSHGIVRPG